ncbi:MAG: ribosome biogenesis GTP-binding protein YihA/YsxC [Flavobacteriales bacterium]|nr:ribosome biogenesis GTP-binding protein YihA/YsxC [Flavobacteriales bacterium]MDG1395848.1 ribosome biogenesis GTP-binding protein YihA/YsxC [Flavobacteriales bacterium]
MKINSAEFVISNTDIEKCPKERIPEYAFIGRSNVGKSSLINMLTSRKSLAKTSGKPGKTQLINHFKINDNWFLVDLPGYGYAKVSKKDRSIFAKFIYEYLEKRENLICTFVLVDSRHEPQKIDLLFMEWLGQKGIPFVIVFTKMDKLSSSQLNKNLSKYKSKMLETWEELPQSFMSSAESKLGKIEILKFIDTTNETVKEKL